MALSGIGLVVVGAWARRDVRRTLLRERVVAPGDSGEKSVPVTSAAAARALAETIRDLTLEATGGRTYSETDAYLAADGSTTPDPEQAATDETTGRPRENPDVELWMRSTTLQTALMQAYLAFRISDLMLALGGSLVLAGIGIRAAGRP